jgi:HK97 family phage major capsid protein
MATRSELMSRIAQLADAPSISSQEEREFESLLLRVKTLDSGSGSGRTSSTGARGDLRTMPRGEVRDRALRVVEAEGQRRLNGAQLDHLEKLLRTRDSNTDGAVIGRMLIASETDEYHSAFQKAVTSPTPVFTPAESAAILEFRAASEGTGSAGGYGIPVLIDPSIILQSGALDAPILKISRTVVITTDAWKGVSSAAVTWAYGAEASVVGDNTATLTQPTVSVYKAAGFIPYSIEVGQDYPGFADEMGVLLNQGYVNLVAQQSMTGFGGTTSPRGIFTAMTALSTGINGGHVTVTTAGTIGGVDVRNTWAAVPEMWRPNAKWVMSPTTMAVIRGLGNNLAMSDFTINLLADGTETLTGREVLVSDYAPAFSSTTGAQNYAVVGDFSNFLIVQRAGMTVELVPHLFDSSTQRPTGQRGWYATSRHGFDVVNPAGFRLLANS